MLFNEKKAVIELELLMILFTTSLILIVTILILYPVSINMIDIDEKKLKTQTNIKKIFSPNCFFNNDIMIKKKDFNSQRLNDCFVNVKDEIYFRIKISEERNYTYVGNEDNFLNKFSLCGIPKSTILCTRMVYPIAFLDNENNIKIENLIFESITIY